MSEIKRHIITFLNGASPRIARFVFGRIATPTEAEINKELADKFGEIAERMRRERTGGPTLSSAGEETVGMLREFLETGDVGHLRRAKDGVKSECPSCARNIQKAIEAQELGDEEGAKELIYGLIGALTVGQRFKGGATD